VRRNGLYSREPNGSRGPCDWQLLDCWKWKRKGERHAAAQRPAHAAEAKNPTAARRRGAVAYPGMSVIEK
jgi:hypothetical protein